MNFQEILFSAIGTILTGLLVWLVSIVTNWINSKIKDKNAAKILTSITTLVTNVVQATYQSYVEALKGMNKQKKKAQEEALNKAFTTIKNQLNNEGIKFIEENYGNVEEYIKTLIESILYKLKNK